MIKKGSLKPIFVEGRKTSPWKIDLPASVSDSRKRTRFYFRTKIEADTFAEKHRIKLVNNGLMGVSLLAPSQEALAAKAFKDLEPFGVTLGEVVTYWIERKKERARTVTFEEASKRYLDHLTTSKDRAYSDSYLKQIELTFPRFPSIHSLPLTDIDSRKIAECMGDMTPAVKNAMLRVLSAFFTWCGQTPREWLRINPAKAEHIKRTSRKKEEVKLYTGKEIARLLTSCPADLLPYHLFGLFAGIRPEEIERMQWEHVDLAEGYIALPGSITKTSERRNIKIEPTLSDWLNWWIEINGIPKGPVTPLTNLRRRMRELREEAKIEVIQDGLRHCYASNWLAVHKSADQLREYMGHKSASVLWQHYHRAVSEREAREFWAILPPNKAKSEKVLKFKGAK